MWYPNFSGPLKNMMIVHDRLCKERALLQAMVNKGAAGTGFGMECMTCRKLYSRRRQIIKVLAMHAGLMHATTQTALAVHDSGSNPVFEDAWISTALLRPLLHSAARWGTVVSAPMECLYSSTVCMQTSERLSSLCARPWA